MSEHVDRLNSSLADRYVIQRELGSGGMATVFLAQDLKHHRSVAIKVLRPELSTMIGPERFLREIKIVAGLHHPHILPLHDSGDADGLLYYVMPYAADESLRQRLLREKQLPLTDALRITREVADALDYAHRHGVVHRDIKPENILLAEQHAMVADFGIARAIQAAGGQKLTATGVVIGTPSYMSPEQTTGSLDLDARSDQYSLGCVLFEMLAGQPPFAGPTAESLAHQHLSVAPRPVTDLRPTVPREVARAITRALAKAPADRYPTSADLAAALAPLVETAGEAGLQRSESPAQGGRPWPSSRAIESQGTIAMDGARAWRGWLLVAVAISALVIALAVWRFGFSLGRDRPQGPAKKSWVLVAEFDGPQADREILTAARELVGTALDQSAILATVPRAQLKEALRLAGKPDTTRISGDVARELAYRASVRAVIEGRLSRVGGGWLVVLRAIRVEDDSTLFAATETAKDPNALIPGLGRLAHRLRTGLGENPGTVQATRPLNLVATPSFEAYRLFVRARELSLNEGDDRGSLAPLEAALRIDPDFAAAWAQKGFVYDHLGRRDSELVAFEQALRHGDRLTERQQLFVSGITANLKGDLASADAIWEHLIRRDPNDAGALGNRSALFGQAGRYEEALACAERAARIGPFAPQQWVLSNVVAYSLQLGRLEVARDAMRHQRGWNAQYSSLGLLVAAGDWARADSAASRFVADPTVSIEVSLPARLVSASGRAEAGVVQGADHDLGRGQVAALESGRSDLALQVARARALLAIAWGTDPGPLEPTLVRDATASGLITRAMWALATRDPDPARRLLRELRLQPAGELARHGAGPLMMEAWAAGESGRWEETVRSLAPAAWRGTELGNVTDPIGRVPMRWLVASAFDHLGRPDSAAAYLELTLRTEGMTWEERVPLRMISSAVHRKLVVLYARMGRRVDAERHWRALAATIREPDPGVRLLIEEARTALASPDGQERHSGR